MKRNYLYILSILFLTSCYKDKEELLYPVQVSSCTPNKNISFTNDLKPILIQHCDKCHTSSKASKLGGGLVLETYSQVHSSVNKNNFISSIKQDGKATAMPKNEAKLSACDINAFETWVFEGAANN